MKKFIAILMTVFLLASALGIAAVPASAAPEYTVTVCGLGKDGLVWAIGLYEDFEDASNYNASKYLMWQSITQHISKRHGIVPFATNRKPIGRPWKASTASS